jgi:hypothetical protein
MRPKVESEKKNEKQQMALKAMSLAAMMFIQLVKSCKNQERWLIIPCQS